MAKLKEIRSRINSVKNTRQVTSAMKMVSAAKLKKAQDLILQIAPYDRKFREIVNSLGEASDLDNIYLIQPEIQNVLIVVVGANRGLCGGFNSNIVKTATEHAFKKYNNWVKNGKVHFLPVGRQVEKGLTSMFAPIEHEENQLWSDFTYREVNRIAHKLMYLFSSGSYQRIDIVYHKFRNAAVQEQTIEQYLPVSKSTNFQSSYTSTLNYLFEPTKEEVFSNLIPQWLVMQLYRILLDSNAAEQGARMTAMHKATDNATEMLKDLRTTYNNARQAAITNEIVEITAGAEALRG